MVVRTKPWFFYQIIMIFVAVGAAAQARAAQAPPWATGIEWEFLLFALVISVFSGAAIGLAGGVPKEFQDVKLWSKPTRFFCGLCTGFGIALYLVSENELTAFVIFPSFLFAFCGQFVAVAGQKAVFAFMGRVFGGSS